MPLYNPGTWPPPVDNITSLSNVVPSYSTLPRYLVAGSQSVMTSQSLLVAAAPIPGGSVITNLGFYTGGTAAITPANWWMVLLSSARVVLGVTADQLTTAIGSFAKFSLALGTPVTVPGSASQLTFTYIGLMVNAGTVPSLEGGNAFTLPQQAPAVQGYSSTGQTTPPALAATMGSIGAAATAAMPYFFAD